MMKTWLIRRGAQTGLARRYLAHQLVRVQAALHQEFAFGRMDQLDAFRRGGLAVRHAENLEAADIETVCARHGGNLRGRPPRIRRQATRNNADATRL
jgi:hypothetical protein